MSPLELIPKHACVPVVTAMTTTRAVQVAGALQAGGVRVVEITLRAGDAFAAVSAVREQCPELVVALGTVLTPDQVARAARCGAHFIVSPGYTERVARAVRRHGLPWVPGVCTPSEIMVARDAGFRFMKYFPAQAAGGTAMLCQLLPVFPDVTFFPTGGISEALLPDYLALPNVHCVGGSWVVPGTLIEAGDWAGITALARRAAAPS